MTFESRLRSFYNGCKHIRTEDCGRHGYLDKYDQWGMSKVKSWIRVTAPFAVCSINENGDVLLPAGYSRPDTTRTYGNIFDEYNGLQHVGPWGL